MISLKQWMELVEYRITEGSDYCWDCYGPDAHTLDSWNGEQDGHSFSVTFDTKTQVVYEVQAHDYSNQRAYRMINPEYAKKHKKECKRRGVDLNEAWDCITYVDLETEEDFMSKAQAIFAGEDYDTRVKVPVDFTDAELLAYMKIAHERDITFNQLVEEALREAISDFKQDPEGAKDRAKQWKAEYESREID